MDLVQGGQCSHPKLVGQSHRIRDDGSFRQVGRYLNTLRHFTILAIAGSGAGVFLTTAAIAIAKGH